MGGKSDIVARIHLRSTSAGGLRGQTPPGLFRCRFAYKGEQFDCALILDETGPLSPGQRVAVPIVFLRPDLIKPRLLSGSKFTLRERGTFATGVVTQVIPD